MTKKAEPVDMSPGAIAQRLETMRERCELMSYLSKFRPLVEAAEAARKPKQG